MIKTDEFYNDILKEKVTIYKDGNFEYKEKERDNHTEKILKYLGEGCAPCVKIDENNAFKIDFSGKITKYEDIDSLINNLESLKSIMKELNLKDETDPEIEKARSSKEKDKEMIRKYLKERKIMDPLAESLMWGDLLEYKEGKIEKPDWLTWE